MFVHEALARLQRMIGDTDYMVRAVAVEDGFVDVAVTARDAACAECLVPKEMMRSIADECLAGTGHRVRELRYPGDARRDRAVEVVCARSGVTVRVGPGTAILDALEEAGLPVSSSCREGICGTCETTVLEGTVDHRDSLLTDGERAAGRTMMICCSRSLGEKLVLDV